MVRFGRRRFLQVGLCAGGLLALRNRTSGREPVEVRRAGHALGTKIEITVLHDDRQAGERAIDAALAAVDRVEETMSLYRPNGELRRLNRDGALSNPHPWLVEVLRQAQALSRVCNGAFDVTVQPLWTCWKQAADESRLPTEAELAAARRLVDWRSLSISPQQITLHRAGMQVTLNGIAQGFAADQAVAALQAAGVRHALLNTGEVHTLGSKRDEPWVVGVQHPRHADAYSALAKLSGRALSTSGDYATHFTPDRRHHHILDPRTGYSSTELASATVVAPTAAEADALSTAMLVLGVEAALRLAAERSDVDALLVCKDGRTLATPGFPEEAQS